MDLAEVLDETPSKHQFAELLQSTKLTNETKLGLLESYPREFIDEDFLRKYFEEHSTLSNEYQKFLKMCQLDIETLEDAYKFKIHDLGSLEEDQTKETDSSSVSITLLEEAGNPRNYTIAKLIELMLGGTELEDLQTHFLAKMSPHPNLLDAFLLLPETIQAEYQSKILPFLDETQLLRVKQSAERDAILLAADCENCADTATTKASEDLEKYWEFLSGGASSEGDVYCLTDNLVSDIFYNLKLEHFDMFLLHSCALREASSSKFSAKLLQETRELLLEDSLFYVGEPDFKILYRDELHFSILLKANSETKVMVNVFLINTKIAALGEIAIEDLVLRDPEFSFEIQNSKSIQIHSFAIEPDFETDFIVEIVMQEHEESFLVKFHKALVTKTVSIDLERQILEFSHTLMEGTRELDSCAEDELLNEFEAIQFKRLGPSKLSVEQHFKVQLQPTFFEKLCIDQMMPLFFIFSTINEEDLLSPEADLTFDVYLGVRAVEQQILCLEGFSCTIVVRSGEKAASYVSESKGLSFKLPRRAERLDIQLKFPYGGKELIIESSYQLRHSSCLRLLRFRNIFAVQNLLGQPAPEQCVNYAAYSPCGHIDHQLRGNVEVPDTFEYVTASLGHISCASKRDVRPMIAELGAEIGREVFEDGIKRVTICSDFSKNYFYYQDGEERLLRLFIKMGGFRLFQDGSYDIEPVEIRQFPVVYHSSHDAVVRQELPVRYNMNQRICVQFRTKDTYIIEKLLEKPHQGLACELISLQMAERDTNHANMCDYEACNDALCCSMGGEPECCSEKCKESHHSPSVRNHYTVTGPACAHVIQVMNNGRIEYLEK